MRTLAIALAGLLTVGCQQLPPAVPASAEVASDEAADPVAPAPRNDSEYWLVTRQLLCALPMVEQRARLMETALEAGSDRDHKLQRVLLASCHPEHTPGLLREALNDLGDDRHWSDGERALVALLRDHARSYRLLEEKNSDLAAQLEATINGIREIEADMNSLTPNRVAP
ncbi:MAG: hypothetical protein WC247_13910 [Porticoccaceae bacterium]